MLKVTLIALVVAACIVSGIIAAACCQVSGECSREEEENGQS